MVLQFKKKNLYDYLTGIAHILPHFLIDIYSGAILQSRGIHRYTFKI